MEVVHTGVLRQYGHRPEGDMVDVCGRFCSMQSVPEIRWVSQAETGFGARHGHFYQAPEHLAAWECNEGAAEDARQKFGPQPGINWDHELAVQQWCREEASALVPDSGVVVTESVARDRRSAFIHLRTLLETQGVVLES